MDQSQWRLPSCGTTLVISAFVHRLRALWFTIWYQFCSYSHSRGRRIWTTLAGLWHFRAGLWVFILFCPTAPFSGGPICAISHWCDGFQALLSVLLIKQNEADCRRWLGADRSRYCNQHTKKPFIKVLSDLKLWIYQSLLTNEQTTLPTLKQLHLREYHEGESLSHSVMSDFLWPPWTVTCQAPLSLEFSRQEYWSGSPFPSPGDLPDSKIKPRFPALLADSLLSEPPGKPT